MKKHFKLLAFLFIPLAVILLIQCNEPVIEPVDQETDLSLNKGEGEVEETAGNNLSFPALLADGVSRSPITESLTVPYDGEYEGLTQEEIDALEATDSWYAQKVEGNVWQAEYATYDGTPVTFIDWGDMMEAVDPKVGTPYRVEFGVYAQLSTPMSAYTMALLAYPSSPDETQGTDGTRYDCNYATIASPMGKCVIQRYDEDATLKWNAVEGQWDGADPPEDVKFAQELNVGGKFIFGASTGGFVPEKESEYRITFYFQEGSEVSLVYAQVGDYNGGTPIIPKFGERNTAVVDDIYDLTYMDVTATGGGRGGLGNGGDEGGGNGNGGDEGGGNGNGGDGGDGNGHGGE